MKADHGAPSVNASGVCIRAEFASLGRPVDFAHLQFLILMLIQDLIVNEVVGESMLNFKHPLRARDMTFSVKTVRGDRHAAIADLDSRSVWRPYFYLSGIGQVRKPEHFNNP
jgi:hypothetical protein